MKQLFFSLRSYLMFSVLFCFGFHLSITAQSGTGANWGCAWGDTQYTPTENDDIKYIKIIVHVIRDGNGQNNFQETYEDIQAIKLMVDRANYFLCGHTGKDFWIDEDAEHNSPPPDDCSTNPDCNYFTIDNLPPSNIRFVLFPFESDLDSYDPDQDGIYFWDVDQVSPYMNYSTDISSNCPSDLGLNYYNHNQWYDIVKRHTSEAINIILVNDHPDYIECIRELNENIPPPIPPATEVEGNLIKKIPSRGVANGFLATNSYLVLAGFYTHYHNLFGMREDFPWFSGGYIREKCSVMSIYGQLLIHEVGHNLGLYHTNALNNSSLGSCDGINNISLHYNNNFMSYTPNLQREVFTPCQLSFMHCNLENPNSTVHSYLLKDTDVVQYCSEEVGTDFTMSGNIEPGIYSYRNIYTENNTNAIGMNGNIEIEASRSIVLSEGFSSNILNAWNDVKLNIDPDMYETCSSTNIFNFPDFSNMTQGGCNDSGGFHVGPGFDFGCHSALGARLAQGPDARNSHYPMVSYCGHDHKQENPEEFIKDNNKDGGSLIITPNPSDGIFRIENIDGFGNYFITVYDVQGRIVQEKNGETDFGNIPMDLKGLNNGVYFISIKNDSGHQEEYQKIIIQE